MWCEKCSMETEYNSCPKCHSETVPVPEGGVYWCKHCNIPVMKEPRKHGEEQLEMVCPICGSSLEYLTSDMRPVFPEERLLMELLLNKKPHTYVNSSVWASNNRYYVDGRSITISNRHFQNADVERLGELLEQYSETNSYNAFKGFIDLFVRANTYRLNYIKKEAIDFIRRVAKPFDKESLVISFSGGKDSTATADVVVKAFGEFGPKIVHIFGDTTLEFPMTY